MQINYELKNNNTIGENTYNSFNKLFNAVCTFILRFLFWQQRETAENKRPLICNLYSKTALTHMHLQGYIHTYIHIVRIGKCTYTLDIIKHEKKTVPKNLINGPTGTHSYIQTFD